LFDFPNSPSVGQVYQPAGGPSWTWDGTVWKSYQTNGETAIARTFIPGSQSGATTYVYNKPANLRHLEFEGVAAGGSAGGSAAAGAGTYGFGSGGGGGAWGKKLFTAAQLPSSVTITIGAPGAAVFNAAGINGIDGAATTFGSLITLPGGLKGFVGSNIAYTSWNTVSGSGYTAMPTGVDAGRPGESSDYPIMGIAYGSSPGGVLSLPGRGGGSPWAATFPGTVAGAGGLVSNDGRGYGWGPSGPVSAGSQGAKQGNAGGPGAVMLTEYLAVAPVNDAVQPVVVTPWVQYTPVFTGFGTVTGSSVFSRRVGDTLHIKGRFATGTATAVEGRVSFGWKGIEGGLVADAAKLAPATNLVGKNTVSFSGANDFVVLAEPSVGYLTFGAQSGTSNGLAKVTGNLFGTGSSLSFTAEVPIQGW
jgi:hypothetical protein